MIGQGQSADNWAFKKHIDFNLDAIKKKIGEFCVGETSTKKPSWCMERPLNTLFTVDFRSWAKKQEKKKYTGEHAESLEKKV